MIPAIFPISAREQMVEKRDRVIEKARAYAVANALSDEGLLQAAVRFALASGWEDGFDAGYDHVLVEKATTTPIDLRKNPYIPYAAKGTS